MIKLTDEMVQLALDTFLATPTGTIAQIDDGMRQALAAVVAIVERDQAEVTEVRRQRDNAYATNRELLAELEQGGYSGWIVARADGRTCVSCGWEIRRGEAYAVDTTLDLLRHIHCPDRTGASHDRPAH